MRLGLGIDAGGTFTDAAVIDLDSQQVIASHKALTTKGDYALGVSAAIDGLFEGTREGSAPGLGVSPAGRNGRWGVEDISMVALSTTLATNAIVEGKGGSVGLILIGYEESVLHRLPPVDHWRIIRGRHGIRGDEIEPLDREGAARAVRELAELVDALAISSYLGVRNPEHEQVVAGIARDTTSIPWICGHELTNELNSVERATTALLNARLIPLIVGLIRSVKRVLRERGINAPLFVVKSDGSLMSEEIAMMRPIETAFSGPVASIAGGRWLTGLKDGLVIDMGGTTTDMAFLSNGMPRMKKGATIQGHLTTIRSLDVITAGLGGDSEIRLQKLGRFAIGPRRVVPVSYLADLYPEVLDELEAWRDGASLPVDAGLVAPVEFFVLPTGARTTGDTRRESGTVSEIIGLLRNGPMSRFKLAEALGQKYVSLLRLEDLEDSLQVQKVGLTPTDVLHASGELNLWNVRAAKIAVELVSSRLGMDAERFTELVKERISRMILDHVLSCMIREEAGYVDRVDCAKSSYYFEKAFFERNHGPLRVDIKAKVPLIGVGAPIQSYLPQVGKLLGADVVIPEHAGVANAIGAVVGKVSSRCEMVIRPSEEGGFRIYSPRGPVMAAELDEARSIAGQIAREEAMAAARKAGAVDIEVEVSFKDKFVKIFDEGPNSKRTGVGVQWITEDGVYLETLVVAEASGAPQSRER